MWNSQQHWQSNGTGQYDWASAAQQWMQNKKPENKNEGTNGAEQQPSDQQMNQQVAHQQPHQMNYPQQQQQWNNWQTGSNQT